MREPKRYPVELRERSVRFLLEQQNSHQSQWATICSITGKIGCARGCERASASELLGMECALDRSCRVDMARAGDQH